VAAGRVGLLGILFDFIAEGRRIPVIGGRGKPYQFIDADDYAAAILLGLHHNGSDIFHVGSHAPCSLEDSYAYVIKKAGSSSKIKVWPAFPALPLMRLCHNLGISPLGPYHYNMIAEEFIFDTSHAEATLGWRSSKTNGEILYAAYDYYVRHRAALESSSDTLSAHRRRSRRGVLNVLRRIS
jgi:UDP-glucose 4-epimerase